MLLTPVYHPMYHKRYGTAGVGGAGGQIDDEQKVKAYLRKEYTYRSGLYISEICLPHGSWWFSESTMILIMPGYEHGYFSSRLIELFQTVLSKTFNLAGLHSTIS